MMKFCGGHLSSLEGVVRHKGMGHLMSSTEAQMHERMDAWLKGTATREQIDPMLVCSLEITKKAVDVCGPRLNHPLLEFCPLCEVEKRLQRADAGEQWIDNCTDAVLILCKANEIA